MYTYLTTRPNPATCSTIENDRFPSAGDRSAVVTEASNRNWGTSTSAITGRTRSLQHPDEGRPEINLELRLSIVNRITMLIDRKRIFHLTPIIFLPSCSPPFYTLHVYSIRIFCRYTRKMLVDPNKRRKRGRFWTFDDDSRTESRQRKAKGCTGLHVCEPREAQPLKRDARPWTRTPGSIDRRHAPLLTYINTRNSGRERAAGKTCSWLVLTSRTRLFRMVTLIAST